MEAWIENEEFCIENIGYNLGVNFCCILARILNLCITYMVYALNFKELNRNFFFNKLRLNVIHEYV